MSAVIITDALWGDSGKGKISAYLARAENASYVVRCGTGTNAGHSLYFGKNLVKLNQLPLGGLANPKSQIRIGSGVVVDPEIFLREIKEYHLQKRTKIDFRCAIIEPRHKQAESNDSNLSKKIGSTKTGTGFARAEFIMRRARQAKDVKELKGFTSDAAKEINDACLKKKTVILEGSQGTFLSLALSPDYPFTTSDNCTTLALADDAGLNWKYIKDVVMIVKAVPSRVGEGPMPFELSSEEIEKRDIREYGVTTGRPRRKAARIDWNLLKYATMLNGPTQIALTFCDHFDLEVKGVREVKGLTAKVKNLIKKVEKVTQTPVTLVETGKDFEDIIALKR